MLSPRPSATAPKPAATPAARAALDDRRDGLDQRVDVGGRGGVAEGEPQRGAGLLVVTAHREQDVRGLGHAGRAGRPRRAGDAPRVESISSGVALAAGEGQVGVARQPVLCRALRVAVDRRVGDLLPHPPDQVVAQGAQPLEALGLVLDRELDGGGEADDGRGVDRARPDVALLSAAVHLRHQRELPGVRRARRHRRGRRPCAR